MEYKNFGGDSISSDNIQVQNGRVINVNEKPVDWFRLFDKNEPNTDFQTRALYGIQNLSTLNQTFFSKENVKLLQDMIRYNVYLKSDKKYIIGNQSTIELEVIMRSIFLQYAQNLPYMIKEQIKELNNMVVNTTIPRIISQIEQYIGYIHEVEHNPVPIPLPVNLSNAGTKMLKSVVSTF